jgi:hypothetical protein
LRKKSIGSWRGSNFHLGKRRNELFTAALSAFRDVDSLPQK